MSDDPEKPWSRAEGIMHPYEVPPPDGYERPEKFPHCCPNHKRLYGGFVSWFDRFPNCCEEHKKLLAFEWFRKEDYENLPNKLILYLSFTEHVVESSINKESWFKDITDYIEYIFDSFGKPGPGSGRYIDRLVAILKLAIDYNKLPIDKIEVLIDHIEGKYGKPHEEIEVPDLNLLHATYQKWLNAFPDLGYFQQIKEKTKGKFPMNLVVEDLARNQYSGLAKGRIISNKELIEKLVGVTKHLLENFNTIELLKKGHISDIDKHRFDLIREAHRVKQTSLLGSFSKGETKYLRIIREWLTNEKAFFKEIEPLFGKVPELPNPKPRPTAKKKDLTFLELFRSNEERVIQFFKLLKGPGIDAIDENNRWIFNERKNSIVACFAALEDLGIVRQGTKKAALRRIIETRIKFSGSERLFRDGYNPDDYHYFSSLFHKHF